MSPSGWPEANKRYLTAALAVVRSALERRAGREVTHDPGAELRDAAAELPVPSALEQLVAAFGLSPFERDVLLLAAGPELDASFASLIRELGEDGPSFALALAVLPEAHWSAVAAAAPLRAWRLVEPARDEGVATAPLRIDERVLHFLTGTSFVDERLAELVTPLPTSELPPSQASAAEDLAARWRDARELPVLSLSGPDLWSRRDVAAAAASALGFVPYAVRASDVPGSAPERAALVRLWEREAVLAAAALVVELDGVEAPETVQAVEAFADRTRAPLVLSGREPIRPGSRPFVHMDVAKPEPAEQRQLWHEALHADAAALNGTLDRLTGNFHLGARDIAAAAGHALAVTRGEAAALPDALWAACRSQSRRRLEDLAHRVRSTACWDDLVLPAPARETIHQIVAQVRGRTRVYDEWGFAARTSRGLGISVLFHGPSGTGKTLAAEVIASELDLDLLRIDLSQVVSKYIGETEKNLRRVFDAAEDGGAVLLFDEADALFGKRSEVKDSHDRYANIEVGYLLQRMEAYRGLAILTTNVKGALDSAFLRRLRFVVAFPFPDPAQRAQIWERAFPEATPTARLEPAVLARLNVAGGSISNIALGAAFLAAEDGTAVTPAHVLRAARSEYAKHERPLTAAETEALT